MEAKKKHRKVLRAAFTKKANELQQLLGASDMDNSAIKIVWDILQESYEALKVVDGEIYDFLLEEDATEEILLKEMEGSEEYKRKYLYFYHQHGDVLHSGSRSETSVLQSQGNASTSVPAGKRKFKLPTIQFKVFDGSIKEWLPFWAQFRKVHDDPEIDLDDKVEYLIQATVQGSRARQLVESFPAVGDNYSKMVDSLTSRFGREDLQIEVYIRELLKLVLHNATSNTKLDLSTLYDKLETHLRALDTLGITSDKCAAMIFPLIESCLPEELLRVWQRSPHIISQASSASQSSLVQSGDPTMEQRLMGLMRFLQNEVENEQRIKMAADGFGLRKSSAREAGRNGAAHNRKMLKYPEQEVPTAAGLVNLNTEGAKCLFCGNYHDTANCIKAQDFSLDKRKSILSEKRACFSCLKVGHPARKCRIRLKCIVCGKSHFALMCSALSSSKQENDQQISPKTEKTLVLNELVSCTKNTSTHVFMQTLKFKLDGVLECQTVRALIDTGSQRSYILQSTARRLGYKPKCTVKMVHCLFGGTLSAQEHECYDVKLCNGSFSIVMEALAQPVICTEISQVFQGPWTQELDSLGIKLSDENNDSNCNDKIDILIGSDLAGKLFTGRRHLLPCGLVTVETFLGWTLMGKIPLKNSYNTTMTDITLFVKEASLPQLWDLDILGIRDPTESKTQDELAMAAKDFFKQTVKVNNKGRYEVRLPWLEGHPALSSAYHMAKNRLQNTVCKLKKDGLMEEYDLVFRDWLDEGIIEEVLEEVPAVRDVHYLPHRPVVKEGSTTKIRPVFDASAKEKGKPSLNQCLEKGPNNIELIPNILLRFRLNKIGVISDIRKAFLQISLNEADRNFLRFIWMDKNNKEIIFRHKRVVFGVSSSPFLLGATIEHHLTEALKNSDRNQPYTKRTITQLLKSFYVDNCVTSVPSENDLKTFIEQSTILMSEAKFDLRGWEFSGQVHVETSALSLTAVLGMLWDTQNDTLRVNATCIKDKDELVNKTISKRIMLSFAQRIFDPIGFIAPATLLPKLLLQRTWEQKLGWDTPVDPDIEHDFRKWMEELPFLLDIEIPRWIHHDDCDIEHGSLHTFCDASKDSYAAVIFFRGVHDGKVFVRLLAAKSRIAPLKKVSIPRLELLAALIGTRLYVSLKEDLNLDTRMKTYFWTDSSTVLFWLRRKEDWATFVGNRVSEIRKYTSSEMWHLVPGTMNPADLPSRGCSPKQLCKSKWWEGPSWLYEESHLWPQENVVCNDEEINSEKKKKLVTSLVVSNVEMSLEDWHLLYFSKFTKIIRMPAWIFRFLYNIKTPSTKQRGELTAKEIDAAEIHLLKLIQSESFSDENDPRLSSLNPFKDELGLLRLKSRVSSRSDVEHFRFPIVLPAKHVLVNKLIFEQHVKSNHIGTQGLMSILREHYWILGGRRAIKAAITSCVICKRHRSKPFVTSLPPLPQDRVRDAAAFEITGIDFAGPLFLKTGVKAWVCLFTCAVYRAVHLELCTSLSVSSFVQALRRFIARRGRPKTIYTDNGTNFVGTANAFNKLDWQNIELTCSVDRITWRFNPPTASWWGGFWERLVGILKQMLRKVLGRASVTYEDMVTILCDCEAVINSRPLTYISADADELIPLTPSMFLREQVESGIPDGDLVDRQRLCKKSLHIQKLRDDLRQRFRNEYLGQLKSWLSKKPNRQITLGEIVLVGNDNDKRLHWPLGRVIELIPGKDGQVRLVRVRTTRGSLLRPVQRLFPLECAKDSLAEPGPQNGTVSNEDKQLGETPRDCHSPESGSTVSARSGVSPGVLSRASVPTVKITRSGRETKVPKKFL